MWTTHTMQTNPLSDLATLPCLCQRHHRGRGLSGLHRAAGRVVLATTATLCVNTPRMFGCSNFFGFYVSSTSGQCKVLLDLQTMGIRSMGSGTNV